MNICVKCKHHAIKGNSSLPTHWSDHQCHHPDMRRTKAIDPVTGKKCFTIYKSFVYDEYPTCRDTNEDGHCQLFKRIQP